MKFHTLDEFGDGTCQNESSDYGLLDLYMPHCLRCGCREIVWRGWRKNKRKGLVKRLRCKGCGYRFTDDPTIKSHFPLWIVGRVLELTVEGLRRKQIVSQIKREAELRKENITICASSLPNIIKKYVKLLLDFEIFLKPKQISSQWQIDDTPEIFPCEINGENKIGQVKNKNKKIVWITNIVDLNSRYWLVAYVSPERNAEASESAIRLALKRAKCGPQSFKCDGLRSHKQGIKKVLKHTIIYSVSKKVDFAVVNTIESLHSFMRRKSIKKRGKFRSIENLQYEVDLLRIYWNFLHSHESLGGSTPARKAGILYPAISSWDGLIRFAHSVVSSF